MVYSPIVRMRPILTHSDNFYPGCRVAVPVARRRKMMVRIDRNTEHRHQLHLDTTRPVVRRKPHPPLIYFVAIAFFFLLNHNSSRGV